MSRHPIQSSLPRHRFSLLLAGLVVLLIAAGALVTSTGSGLSVPDWPLSFGSVNPSGWWQMEGVRAEHGHRLFAGLVAMLTVSLAVWTSRREPRRWVRRLAWAAVAAVLLQAVLGGVTVLLALPLAVSVGHAGLAELFLCLVVSLAVVTSPSWCRGPARPAEPAGLLGTALLATVTTVLIYCQILLGAVMRHAGAGLAIPDFPLAFGRVVPMSFDFPVAIHYAHRVGALVVLAAVVATVARVTVLHRRSPHLSMPAVALGPLAVLQVTLGAAVVLSGRAVVPNTVHVATGALLLVTSLVLALESHRESHLRQLEVERPGAPAGAEALGEAAG